MTPEESVREMYRRIDADDIDGFAALFTEDAVYHRPGCAPLSGRSAIEKYYRQERTIAGGVHTVSRLIVAGSSVAVDGSFSGTLTDGRTHEHRFAEIFELAPGGRFTRRDSFLFLTNF